MSIITSIEWTSINDVSVAIEHLKHYLVTDGYNIEIKWFNGDDWESWSERHSNICNDDITHFADLPYI